MANATKRRVRTQGDLTKDVESIFDDGVLVDLDIGYWLAKSRNTARDLGVKEEKLPKYVIGLGTKRLVPKSLSDRWRRIAGKARYTVRRYSFPFPIGDCAFVPMKAVPKVEDRLRALQQDFDHERKYLVKNYDKIQTATTKQFPVLKPLYPQKAVVSSKFYFTWQLFSVKLPKQAQLAATSRRKAQAAEQAQQRAAAELEKRVQGFVNEAVKTLRAKTAEICEKIADKIKTKEVVTQRSLTELNSFIERFKLMNFAGDDEVERRLEALQREVLQGNKADDFADDEALRTALVSSLNDVRKAAEQVTDIASVTGGYRRRIAV